MPLPPAHETKGPMLMASIWSFHMVAVVVYCIRLWSRLTPKYALTAADYTISVALVARCVSVGLSTAAVAKGFGLHTVYIPRANGASIGVLLFSVFIASTLTSGFARISIICLLLQVTRNRRWRIVLWLVMAMQSLMMISYCVVQLAQCQSAISKKINIKQTQCFTPNQIWSFSYASASTATFSDLICAILPICLIRNLSRSTVEKVLTCILMGSSLMAMGASIAKIYYTAVFDFTDPDGFWLMVEKFYWSRMEESLIIIAACAPLLKHPIERGLKKMGWSGFEIPVRELNSVHFPTDSNKEENSDSESRGSRGRNNVV